MTLSAASGQPVTVNYATANGTRHRRYRLRRHQRHRDLQRRHDDRRPSTSTINGDTTLETDETFVVNLSAPLNATIADGPGHRHHRQRRRCPHRPASTTSRIAEGNSGTSIVTVTVTLAQQAAQTVTINYATANGTATAGSDYVAGHRHRSPSPPAC